MARIVCQAMQRADQLSLIWSDGSAAFEPYHLEGDELVALRQIASQIHASLAADGADLAPLGHRIYRAVFRLDAGDPGSAQAVRTWITAQASANAIDRIDFLCDAPGAVPWNLLRDEGAEFWGKRFVVSAGRRVNPLRQTPAFVSKTQVAAIDADLLAQLGEPELRLLNPLRDVKGLLHAITSVEDELKKSTPDIVLMLLRFEKGRLMLGGDAVDFAQVQAWIEAATAGNPDPIVILMACGNASEQSAWTKSLAAATSVCNGLVANEVLLDARNAAATGLLAAQRFAEGNASIGEVLRTLRHEQGSAALAFSAFCPSQVRVYAPDAANLPSPEFDVPTHGLPDLPYRPFAALEAPQRGLLCGRDLDVVHAAALLDRSCTTSLFMHGSPAVGKTSFLQAGLLPYLEQECPGYRALRDRSAQETPLEENDYPILILRTTNDLAGQFADALAAFCAQPLKWKTPAGKAVTIDLPGILHQAVTGMARPTPPSTAIQDSASGAAITADGAAPATETELAPREIWIALRDSAALLGKALDAVTRSLPYELVIAIDQGEELLTLVRDEHHRGRRAKALAMLRELSAAAPRCKLVYAIRSQVVGDFISLFPERALPAGWCNFFLRPLTGEQMADVLLVATNREPIPYCSEVPFSKYSFAFEEGAVQKIIDEAKEVSETEQQSALPIVHAMGAVLHQGEVIAKKQPTIRADAVKALSAREALLKAFDEKLSRLPIGDAARRDLKNLINRLTIRHPDGTVSRDLMPASNLKEVWKGRDSAEPIVNQAAEQEGLFEIQQLLIDGQPELCVSLPQDSLAQVGRKAEDEQQKKTLARGTTFDVLFIMVPLVFLAAAVAFFLTRRYGATSEDPRPTDEQIQKHIVTSIQKGFNEKARRPLYLGLLAQADLALKADNALRARQILLSQPAQRSLTDEDASDMRGFEWRYLWKQLNSERFAFEGHRGAVQAVAVSPDGKWAATGSERSEGKEDAAIRIWNLASGEIAARIPGPSAGVKALAFSPDSKTLAGAGADKTVYLWDVADLRPDFAILDREPTKLQGHEGAVNALAFGGDAQTLASGGADKTVIVWDVAGKKARHALKDAGAAVHALAFADKGKTLVSGGAESECTVWDAEAGKKVRAIKTPGQTVWSLSVASDGKTLCTAGIESKFDVDLGMLRFWSIETAKELHAAIQHANGVYAVAFHPDSKAVASAGADHAVRLWDVATGKQISRWIGHLGEVRALAFSQDGATLVSGSADRTAKAWDAGQTPGTSVIAAHADWVQALALDRKNAMLASGSRDGSVKIWDAATSKLLHQLPAHAGAVTSLAFSYHEDKTLLAVGTRTDKNAGEIKVWQITTDPKTGAASKEVHTLKGHEKGVNALAFCPVPREANMLVSGSADNTVRVWDVGTGKEKKVFREHKDEVRCVAFASESAKFASGGKDRAVCVYDETLDASLLKDVQMGSVEAVALLPLSQVVVISAGDDQTTRLWSWRKDPGSPIVQLKNQDRHFRGHTQKISSVFVTDPERGMIATASWDGAIKLYDLQSERFTLLGHQGPVRGLVSASDHSFIASAGNDGTVRIWRAAKERASVRDAQHDEEK